MLPNPCKTLGFKKNMIYKIPPGPVGGGLPYTASDLHFAILDLFQRAKTSVHSYQEQHSVTAISDHLEQKKGKQYKIAYLQASQTLSRLKANDVYQLLLFEYMYTCNCN